MVRAVRLTYEGILWVDVILVLRYQSDNQMLQRGITAHRYNAPVDFMSSACLSSPPHAAPISHHFPLVSAELRSSKKPAMVHALELIEKKNHQDKLMYHDSVGNDIPWRVLIRPDRNFFILFTATPSFRLVFQVCKSFNHKPPTDNTAIGGNVRNKDLTFLAFISPLGSPPRFVKSLVRDIIMRGRRQTRRG